MQHKNVPFFTVIKQVKLELDCSLLARNEANRIFLTFFHRENGCRKKNQPNSSRKDMNRIRLNPLLTKTVSAKKNHAISSRKDMKQIQLKPFLYKKALFFICIYDSNIILDKRQICYSSTNLTLGSCDWIYMIFINTSSRQSFNHEKTRFRQTGDAFNRPKNKISVYLSNLGGEFAALFRKHIVIRTYIRRWIRYRPSD
jgi:hypothetical protein